MNLPTLPRHWRILRDPPREAAWNMAVDEALARSREEEVGVLRIYRWARPSLSLGRNQVARGRYDPEAFGPLGVEVVRRPTGGREVLHDRELTYGLVLPLEAPGDLRSTYRLVNQGLVSALASLGVEASTAPRRERTPSPAAGACFGQAAAGEVEAGGRKLVGSAQVRMGRTILQHGSVLLGPASVSLAALRAPMEELTSGGGGGARRPGNERDHPAPEISVQQGVTLAELLDGPVSFNRIASAVEAGLAGVLGGRWARDELRAEERQVAIRLSDRYESWEWTWRR